MYVVRGKLNLKHCLHVCETIISTNRFIFSLLHRAADGVRLGTVLPARDLVLAHILKFFQTLALHVDRVLKIRVTLRLESLTPAEMAFVPLGRHCEASVVLSLVAWTIMRVSTSHRLGKARVLRLDR